MYLSIYVHFVSFVCKSFITYNSHRVYKLAAATQTGAWRAARGGKELIYIYLSIYLGLGVTPHLYLSIYLSIYNFPPYLPLHKLARGGLLEEVSISYIYIYIHTHIYINIYIYIYICTFIFLICRCTNWLAVDC